MTTIAALKREEKYELATTGKRNAPNPAQKCPINLEVESLTME